MDIGGFSALLFRFRFNYTFLFPAGRGKKRTWAPEKEEPKPRTARGKRTRGEVAAFHVHISYFIKSGCFS